MKRAKRKPSNARLIQDLIAMPDSDQRAVRAEVTQALRDEGARVSAELDKREPISHKDLRVVLRSVAKVLGRQLGELDARVALATAILRQLEWVVLNLVAAEPSCPICKAVKSAGHTGTCVLDKFLKNPLVYRPVRASASAPP